MADDSSGTGDSGSGVDGGSSGSGSGTPSETGDYSQLDWKDVMRYVTGSDPDKPEVDGSQTSDPQTIQDAADVFYFTQIVLQRTAENLGQQVEALTGPDGPWQGGAAQALSGAMKTLAKQTQDMADTLCDSTGDYNIPQQLADNAAHLQGAIDKLNDIDYWYAQQALKEAAAEGKDIVMDDGRVAVSLTPDIPPLLDRDMRAVLNTLADNYKVSTNNVGYSTPPTNPVDGSGGPSSTADGGAGDAGSYEPPVSYSDMGSGGGGGASSGSTYPPGSGSTYPSGAPYGYSAATPSVWGAPSGTASSAATPPAPDDWDEGSPPTSGNADGLTGDAPSSAVPSAGTPAAPGEPKHWGYGSPPTSVNSDGLTGEPAPVAEGPGPVVHPGGEVRVRLDPSAPSDPDVRVKADDVRVMADGSSDSDVRVRTDGTSGTTLYKGSVRERSTGLPGF
ncbi:hypothetical protein [Streptomyces griseorubiginosus]|uniref:hypothetical protein n=1 Tax=Streptomyces griseorubiginosus TaxID=67304 RepID=UPI003EBAF22A